MDVRTFIFGITFGLFGIAAAPAAPSDFAGKLYPILQKANCRACHTDTGVASATRLHFPEPDASAAEIESFGRGLSVLVNREEPEKSLLANKPTNRVQHTGGRLIRPGSPEEAVLLDWVRQLSAMDPREATAAAPVKKNAPVVMRRLTHSQYNHTVRDLLGDQTNPAAQFPPEDFVNGFRNQAEAQGVPALLAEAYGTAAERLAANAFRGGDVNGLIPCSKTTSLESCRKQFVNHFGQRAFRRPLEAGEQARYLQLMSTSSDLIGGAQLVVEAMLQSPNFLFRVERGGASKTYEAASRLSYFLWDTMPDEVLFEAAASGALDSEAGIEKQARRMLADPRARESLDEFVSQWLRFDRVINTVKDRRQFPKFTPELAAAMAEESRRLVADTVWNQRDFRTVFTANYSFLTPDLAQLYGLPEPAGAYERVDFPASSERSGLLGQATFLSLTSKPADTSPTARGLFVREQFLCQHVPDPPPGTNANLPPITEAKPQSNRDRLGIHLSNPSCASCHKLIDSIGFGLEKYDAIGQYREKLPIHFVPARGEGEERKRKTVYVELDTSGSISGIENSAFASPKELGKVLAESKQCQECVVKQLFRYMIGRPETPADKPVIEATFARFRDTGFQFQELMATLATRYARFE